MAKKRATGKKRTGNEQEIDTGGNTPGGVPGMFSRAVNEGANRVGAYAAPAPKTPTMPKSGGIKGVRGQVYTPSGVYEGRQVFVRKPVLTENQIQGVLKAQETKAMKEFARHVGTGARAAKVAGAAGALTGAAAYQQGENIVKGLKAAVSAAKKKSRGGGKNKK